MNMTPKFDAEVSPAQHEPVDHAPLDQRNFVQRHKGLTALALVIALGLGWQLLHHPAAPPPPPEAMVTIATPLTRNVNQWDDYVGRFAPSQSVEVRPRVSGAVTAIHFRDGDVVHRGALLFTIDQRPYAAALAEARANVASARSQVALTQSDYARASSLKGDNAVAASETDSLRAKLQAAQAALAAAQARAQARALDMEFTQVRAPITGRISDRKVDIGNLVSGENGAGATLLTTINALDPIYFDFDASEALFLKAQRDHIAHAAPASVQVRLQDESTYRWLGQLTFTDNGLDPKSGTIRLRATFANPTMFLTPGLFGNMRLGSSATVSAMLVPDLAIASDEARKTVLVVGPDGTVTVKPVVLGPVIDGLRVIRSGLAANDRVVIANIQAAMPGAKVKVTTGHIAPAASPLSQPAASPPMAAQATFTR